jgi:PIN domain nuclease of toxin-antitoxin system
MGRRKMIILDTCALIFDALTPEKLSTTAKKEILHAEQKNQLFCCDISLWEIAMLIQKRRIEPQTDSKTFLQLLIQARALQILSITPEIAALSCSDSIYNHSDPADRLIAATALHHRATVVTCDQRLREIPRLVTAW